MSREDESLPEEHLSDPTSRLERGVDHNGEPQWFISTREGWEEAGTREGIPLKRKSPPQRFAGAGLYIANS